MPTALLRDRLRDQGVMVEFENHEWAYLTGKAQDTDPYKLYTQVVSAVEGVDERQLWEVHYPEDWVGYDLILPHNEPEIMLPLHCPKQNHDQGGE